MERDPAPHRKKIGGKVYEKWMIVGRGNSQRAINEMMNRRRQGGRSSVRLVKSRAKNSGVTARIYVRSR